MSEKGRQITTTPDISPRGTRGTRLLGVACLIALIGALTLPGSSALAARGHFASATFGEPGVGDGQFTDPSGIAANEATGMVYVVDRGNNRVEYFDSAGTKLEGEFNGSGSLANEVSAAPSGRFSAPSAIAVDNSCTLHKPVLTEATVPSCHEVDPSDGDVYVADSGHLVIDKYSPSGEYLGQIVGTSGGPFQELEGIATDATGLLWVYQSSGEIDSFSEATNEFLSGRESQAEAKGYPEPGLAVDSKDDLYVVYKYAKLVAELNPQGEVIKEGLGGENVTGVAVELSSNDIYIGDATGIGRFSPTGVLLESLSAEHLTDGSGVGVNSVSETVYATDATEDLVEIFAPIPPSTPTVEGESVTEVTASSATLSAEVNPRGKPTEYHFEYGPCASISACPTSGYGSRLPASDASAGEGFESQPVSVHPQDLLRGTVYHFRAVARNALNGAGATHGEEQTLTTQGASTKLTLLDGRMWELVSPPEKHGALIETIGEGQVTQASSNGFGMTYVAAAPTEDEPQGFSNKVQILSARGPNGWESKDIAPPHTQATGLSQSTGQEYRAFSEDLSTSIVQPFGPFISYTPGSPPSQALAPAEASEQTAFLRINRPSSADPCPPQEAFCYHPLVTGTPAFANVPEGTVFGQVGEGGATCPPETICGPRFKGATPDLSHIVLESGVALTSTPLQDTGLYEWSAGELKLVSQFNGGAAAGGRPQLGFGNRNLRNVISDDGTRVIWSEHEGEEHLYLTDTAREETVQLDGVQGGTGENSPTPAFQFASRDGSKVFFTDGQRLTADSGGGPSASHKQGDLYECEIEVVAGVLTCELTDLTPLRAGESADVLDEVLGASEDGSYVYFVANGDLATGAIQGTCAGTGSKAGAMCDLYVAHHDESGWHIKFIAVLSAEDFPDWNGNASTDILANMPVRVTPNGQWLAFMSQQPLAHNDTRDSSTGQPDEEVYLYDAATGTIACPSCDPTGARPVGVEYKNLRYGLDGLEVWPGSQRIAASVPAWTAYTATGEALYQSRYLSNSGRMFFNTNDALVPQDSNHTGDVYEYEPIGVPAGSRYECTESSSTYSERSGGCVNLISSGESSEESGFLDASENGSDVFFLTASKLVPQDQDTSMDVYDAHECSASSPCFVPAGSPAEPCGSADSCKPAQTTQPSIFTPPSSATFVGTGNAAPVPPPKPKPKPLTRAQKLAKALKACAKKPKRKRPTCRSQAKRAYGPVHKAKTSARRGK
jgi:hypothetical protein